MPAKPDEIHPSCAWPWRATVICAALPLLLAACQPPPDEDTTAAAPETATEAAIRSEARVSPEDDPRLAPDLMKITGIAKWNGLKTARGIWVAHPAVRSPRKVRVFNEKNGQSVDAIVYRPAGVAAGNIVTVSSDAAAALGIEAGGSAIVRIVALRSRVRAGADVAAGAGDADKSPAERVAAMDETQLLHVTSAMLRGLGYATSFGKPPLKGWPPSILAVPSPGAEADLPPMRVAVWPAERPPIGKLQISLLRVWVGLGARHGMVVSIPGYADGATDALQGRGAWMNLMDGPALLGVWRARYSALSDPDRSLLVIDPAATAETATIATSAENPDVNVPEPVASDAAPGEPAGAPAPEVPGLAATALPDDPAPAASDEPVVNEPVAAGELPAGVPSPDQTPVADPPPAPSAEVPSITPAEDPGETPPAAQPGAELSEPSEPTQEGASEKMSDSEAGSRDAAAPQPPATTPMAEPAPIADAPIPPPPEDEEEREPAQSAEFRWEDGSAEESTDEPVIRKPAARPNVEFKWESAPEATAQPDDG